MPTTKTSRKKKMSIVDCTRAHFSKATKAGKLLRTAFARLLFNIVDTQTTGRLTSTMLKVVQTDQVNDFGKKSANTGGLGMLEGFEFNKRKEVRKICFASYAAAVDRTTGCCTLTFPSFLPEANIKFPKGKCYCRLTLAGGALDFEKEIYFTDIQTSEYFTQGKHLALALRVQLPAQQAQPIVLLLGIEFYKKVNDQYLLMYGGGPLALRVVHTDQLLPTAVNN
jgi:hypothetical protein